MRSYRAYTSLRAEDTNYTAENQPAGADHIQVSCVCAWNLEQAVGRPAVTPAKAEGSLRLRPYEKDNRRVARLRGQDKDLQLRILVILTEAGSPLLGRLAYGVVLLGHFSLTRQFAD